MTDAKLAPGEEIKWSGAPDPSALFVRADLFLIPFSFVWAGFAVFWTVSAVQQGAPVFFTLFGYLFVAVGLYIVVGRFFAKTIMKRRTRYFLTTRRAVIVRPGRETAVDLVPGLSRSTAIHGKRMDVVFGTSVGSMAGLANATSLRIYANTGLDFFAAMGPGLPTAFYDVADVAGLTAALRSENAVPK